MLCFWRGEAFPSPREALVRVRAGLAAARPGSVSSAVSWAPARHFLGARRFRDFFSRSRRFPLDVRHFPTILLQTNLLGYGMPKEASTNRASGVVALGLCVAPLQRARRQPAGARTPLARDSAISGMEALQSRPRSRGRACAKSRRGTRNGAAGRAATAQPRRRDRQRQFGEGPASFQAGASPGEKERAHRRAVSNPSASDETGFRRVREAMPRAHTERQRRVRGVREQYGG